MANMALCFYFFPPKTRKKATLVCTVSPQSTVCVLEEGSATNQISSCALAKNGQILKNQHGNPNDLFIEERRRKMQVFSMRHLVSIYKY